MEGYLAEVRLFAGNFAPRRWAFCQGQILSIAQNTALFALVGTTYGGNGQTTFALPDLRSRTAVGPGQGPGLSAIDLGEQAGVENVTLTANEIPAHSHTMQVNASADPGTDSQPSGAYLAASEDGESIYTTGASNTVMAANLVTLGSAGGSQPHTNVEPLLGMNYIICMEGIFPSPN